jgi:hypothetical protein
MLRKFRSGCARASAANFDAVELSRWCPSAWWPRGSGAWPRLAGRRCAWRKPGAGYRLACRWARDPPRSPVRGERAGQHGGLASEGGRVSELEPGIAPGVPAERSDMQDHVGLEDQASGKEVPQRSSVCALAGAAGASHYEYRQGGKPRLVTAARTPQPVRPGIGVQGRSRPTAHAKDLVRGTFGSLRRSHPISPAAEGSQIADQPWLPVNCDRTAVQPENGWRLPTRCARKVR